MEISNDYFSYIILQFMREQWLGYLDYRVFSKQVDAEIMEVNDIVKVRTDDGSCVSCLFMGFKGDIKM